MIEASSTRRRVGIVGAAIAFVFLPLIGCAPETPVIDLGTKGGIPGSQPAPEKVQVEVKSPPGANPHK